MLGSVANPGVGVSQCWNICSTHIHGASTVFLVQGRHIRQKEEQDQEERAIKQIAVNE